MPVNLTTATLADLGDSVLLRRDVQPMPSYGPATEPHEASGATWAMRSRWRRDMTRLPEYDAFLRDSAAAFLVKHDAWLKRREIKHATGARGRVGYVGVGIFGFKAH